MSRRNPRGKVDYLDVELSVQCSAGHLVGRAYKLGADRPDVRLHRYVVSNGVTFQDQPHPDDDSGKVVGVCPSCREHLQIRWERVRRALDECANEGRARGGWIAP